MRLAHEDSTKKLSKELEGVKVKAQKIHQELEMSKKYIEGQEQEIDTVRTGSTRLFDQAKKNYEDEKEKRIQAENAHADVIVKGKALEAQFRQNMTKAITDTEMLALATDRLTIMEKQIEDANRANAQMLEAGRAIERQLVGTQEQALLASEEQTTARKTMIVEYQNMQKRLEESETGRKETIRAYQESNLCQNNLMNEVLVKEKQANEKLLKVMQEKDEIARRKKGGGRQLYWSR